ncbi:hypothetical protein H7J87_25410 [Mycolicibacterium wolinskyi]|uniref:hypothetical protein n=1 Tax=Mycolicibacterium TaxID=1866885 RepID=UPI0013FDA536|nr:MULTISPECIES: hypothetical protein [Mycolicibacterium]MCV7288671.1 hypothetical protein [Mycolicibacterium wolinskyi]MCV7295893.1 hypothetical protein [Mycolicibacterium goodii]
MSERSADDADDKSESDVDDDEKVAESRAGGRYVGRTTSDDAFDAGETGAEARTEDDR